MPDILSRHSPEFYRRAKEEAARRRRVPMFLCFKNDINKLEKEVPHKYLIELREKANSIDDEEESLIISEELG